MAAASPRTLRRFPQTPRTIVGKVGSAVIACSGSLDAQRVGEIASNACAVINDNPETRIVIVSSGAIASGFRALGHARPSKEIVGKQASVDV